APTSAIGTVADRRRPPPRRRNAEVRAREYLTDGEIARLITAAGKNRYGHRDAIMVLVAYRHGLRAGELVTLRWDAVDFAHGRLHVSRRNSGEFPSRTRSAVTNHKDLLPGLDGRSATARRFRDLVNAFVADMGGLDRCSEIKLGLLRRLAATTV